MSLKPFIYIYGALIVVLLLGVGALLQINESVQGISEKMPTPASEWATEAVRKKDHADAGRHAH